MAYLVFDMSPWAGYVWDGLPGDNTPQMDEEAQRIWAGNLRGTATPDGLLILESDRLLELIPAASQVCGPDGPDVIGGSNHLRRVCSLERTSVGAGDVTLMTRTSRLGQGRLIQSQGPPRRSVAEELLTRSHVATFEPEHRDSTGSADHHEPQRGHRSFDGRHATPLGPLQHARSC